MFYYGARYNIAPEGSGREDLIAGGVIAAAALYEPQLRRRGKQMRREQYLERRLLDPQLYLAGLQAAEAPKTVAKLATYPWIPCDVEISEFFSPDYRGLGGLPGWFREHEDRLRNGWRGSPPQSSQEMRSAIVGAVKLQLHLECEAIILPGPLTTAATADFGAELEWIDLGLEVCRDMEVGVLPVYATVALSDPVLRGVEPDRNALIELIADQVGARAVAGVYLVLEQASEQRYVCRDLRTLESLLILIDDLVRGAGKRVHLNYLGPFGLVAVAAGAHAWTSGYYVSQRKLKLADHEPVDARAWPRFYSLSLAGDIGLRTELDRVAEAGLLKEVWTETEASKPLYERLAAGGKVHEVEQWVYRQGNITAAASHFMELMQRAGAGVQSLSPATRVEVVDRWLSRAERLSQKLVKHVGLVDSRSTDLSHQQVWLEAFRRWRERSGS